MKNMERLKAFIPQNERIAVISGVRSLFVAFPITLIYYILFHEKTQMYKDIVAGNITLSGYNKQVDFNSYFLFSIVFICGLFLFSKRYNLANRNNFDLNVTARNYKQITVMTVLMSAAPCVALFLLRYRFISSFDLMMIILFFCQIIVCYKAEFGRENITRTICLSYYIYLACSGILATITYYTPEMGDRVSSVFFILLLVVFVAVQIIIYVVRENQKNLEFFLDFSLIVTQLIVPTCLYALINIRYYHSGVQVELENFDRFESLVIGIAMLLSMVNIAQYIRNRHTKNRIGVASLSTILTLSIVVYYNSYNNLVISTDPFHTGETEVVWEQIVRWGSSWNEGFVSVMQGLGLLSSALNEVLFNGEYATYSHSQSILLIIVVAITVSALYALIEHKALLLIWAPMLTCFLINRSYFIVAVFLTLGNKKIISNPFLWTYMYILTCVFHVWYQPTYGGAVAASLLSALFVIWYKAYHETDIFKKTLPKARIRLVLFVISIVVIGILCMPMLQGVLHFLKTNGYENLGANSIAFTQSVSLEPGGMTVTGIRYLDVLILFVYKYAFGIINNSIYIYILIRYVFREKNGTEFIQGIIMFLCPVIAFYLMLPASLTRLDAGTSRITSITFVFTTILMAGIYLYRNKILNKKFALIVAGILATSSIYSYAIPYFQIHQKSNITITVPETASYVSKEESKLYKLGDVFVLDMNYIKEAQIINELCNKVLTDKQTYYDFTDKSIYYKFTNRKVPGKYVANLVASNYVLQEEVIASIKSNDVPLVYVNNPLRYTGTKEPLRNYRIYKYFIENDYSLINYKGYKFLAQDGLDLSKVESDLVKVEWLNSIGKFDEDVIISNDSKQMHFEFTTDDATILNHIYAKDMELKVSGDDPYLMFKFDKPILCEDVDFIEIRLDKTPGDVVWGQLFIDTDKRGFNEENSVRFEIKSNAIRIPMYMLEQFRLNESLCDLRLDFDGIPLEQSIGLESIQIYNVDQNTKEDFERECNLKAEEISEEVLNELFCESELQFLPSEWGDNFKRMEERFELTRQLKKDQIVYTNEHKSRDKITMKLDSSIKGSEAEFLKLRFDLENNENRSPISVTIQGEDKNGNNFVQKFNCIIENETLLIPIGGSPKCLMAKKIEGINIEIEDRNEKSNIVLKEVQFYKLIH